MPTPKKPAEKRQRTNKPKALDAQVVEINKKSPTAPKGLSKELAAEWRAIWKSPLAATWVDTDLPGLRTLFELRQRATVFDAIGMEEPLVAGSTGQQQINPLLKEASTIRKDILALEDRYGLNPMSRLKLNIELGAAHKSLDDMNARIAKNAAGGDAGNDRQDPRIAFIEAEEA